VAQVVKKFSAVDGTRRPIEVSNIIFGQRCLSETKLIQTTTGYSIPILILLSHLRLALSSGLFLIIFRINFYKFLVSLMRAAWSAHVRFSLFIANNIVYISSFDVFHKNVTGK
jgi:hypothetical protein